MTLAAVAFLPGAPLAVPAVSHGQYDHHRAEVTALQVAAASAAGVVAEVDVVVTIAPGAVTAVHGARRIDLRGFGLPEVVADVAAHPLAAALAALLGSGTTPPSPGPASVESDVLALLALDRRDVAVVAVEVGAELDPAALGTALATALHDVRWRVALLVAADLSAALDATSPRHLVEGAVEVEHRAAVAVLAGDLASLVDLTPRAAEAEMVTWASLVAGTAAVVGLGLVPGSLEHLVTRGVGHLVGVVPVGGVPVGVVRP